MSNVAGSYTYNALTKTTWLRSVHTIEKYLRHLEEAFLLFSLRGFSFRVREQSRSSRKIYCVDNGLVTSASFRFSPDLGKLEPRRRLSPQEGGRRGDRVFLLAVISTGGNGLRRQAGHPSHRVDPGLC